MRYTYVRQHDTTDCAAASLAMVCLHYKKEITITRLRDMMGTDLKGTNCRKPPTSWGLTQRRYA